MNDEIQAAIDLSVKASELFRARQDEQAHQLCRVALRKFLAIAREGDGIREQSMYMLLAAYRAVAVSAFVTKRNGEGRLALGTALANAEVALGMWPDSIPLMEEKAYLEDLARKVGGATTVFISENGTWPFDD